VVPGRAWGYRRVAFHGWQQVARSGSVHTGMLKSDREACRGGRKEVGGSRQQAALPAEGASRLSHVHGRRPTKRKVRNVAEGHCWAIISHCSAIPIMRSCGFSSLRPRAKARSNAALSKPLASYIQSCSTTSCFDMYCSKTRYKMCQSRGFVIAASSPSEEERSCVQALMHMPPRHQLHVLVFGPMFCHLRFSFPPTSSLTLRFRQLTIARSSKRAMVVRLPTNASSHMH
jgi:hypothetical protein